MYNIIQTSGGDMNEYTSVNKWKNKFIKKLNNYAQLRRKNKQEKGRKRTKIPSI